MGARYGTFDTSIGALLLTAEDGALTGVYFPDHTYPPDAEAIGEDLGAEPADEVLRRAAKQLREYLAGTRNNFDLTLAPRGNAFSQQVWEILQQIPRGTTTTYGRIAEQLGNRALAQRVGQAVGHNPISIIIPCHRVVGADGSLTGFAGGLDRKRTLLALEEPSAEASGRLF
ncbi:MAG: methylated-DNA--[protein]-cysteine S-methyltransferase [Leucobacter sp.]